MLLCCSHPFSTCIVSNTLIQGLMLWQPAVLGINCQAGCFTSGVYWQKEKNEKELRRLTQAKHSTAQGPAGRALRYL